MAMFLTELLRESSTKRTCRTNYKKNSTNTFPMKLWFDAECKKQKRIANDAKKVFNRYPGDELNRVIYFREKKIYKTILKRKRSWLLNDYIIS